jgi:alginate O-acetyltransferase complex protein AlgI
LSGAVTFLAVVFAWGIFRAENISSAVNIIRGMIGLNGCILPEELLAAYKPIRLLCRLLDLQLGSTGGLIMEELVGYLSIAMLLVWLAPNTQEFMRAFNPTYDTFNTGAPPACGWLVWRLSWFWAVFFSIILIINVIKFTNISYFIYLQF